MTNVSMCPSNKETSKPKDHLVDLLSLIDGRIDYLGEYDVEVVTKGSMSRTILIGPMRDKIRYYNTYLRRFKSVKFGGSKKKKLILNMLGKMTMTNERFGSIFLDPSHNNVISNIISKICSDVISISSDPLNVSKYDLDYSRYFKNITHDLILGDNLQSMIYGNVRYVCETPEAYALTVKNDLVSVSNGMSLKNYAECYKTFFSEYEEEMSLIERTMTFVRTANIDQRYIDNVLEGLYALSCLSTHRANLRLGTCARIVGYCTFTLDESGSISVDMDDMEANPKIFHTC